MKNAKENISKTNENRRAIVLLVRDKAEVASCW